MSPTGWPFNLAAALLAWPAGVRAARDPGATTRVLFGSCNKARYEQPLWEHIIAREPDAWIWGGDNVYGDSIDGWDWRTGHLRATPATPARLRELYAVQRAQPGYARLLRSNATILGTWVRAAQRAPGATCSAAARRRAHRPPGLPARRAQDDHDFGLNDGDRTLPIRRESQRLFFDFIGEPPLSARRRQRGVYGSAFLKAPRPSSEAAGSAARAAGRSGVLVVLLDVRYHKDPYGADGRGDFLGEEQWAWLERTLRGSRARAHVLVSGLQVLSVKGVGESWSRFPAARRRLLSLLHRLRVAAPILLSGDIHMAELNAARCTAAPTAEERLWRGGSAGGSATGPGSWSDNSGAASVSGLVELTSSGMTHSWGHRPMPSLADGPLTSLAFGAAMHLLQATMPWRYLVRGDGGGALRGHGPAYHLGLNFGQLDFRWDAPDGPRVRLSVAGEGGREVLSRSWALAELDLFGGAGRAHERREPADGREWSCVPLHGGLELLTPAEVASGFCLCALKLVGGLALVAALGARVARRRISPS